MSKRIGIIVFLVLLLLGGFIALTQETGFWPWAMPVENEVFFEEYGEQIPNEEIPVTDAPDFVRLTRWFRSNAGGMVLEEIPSRTAALLNEYALMIDFAVPDELPEYLLPFYNNRFYIEIRILYSQGRESRRQWIFRDEQGTNRLVAVFNDQDIEEEAEEEKNSRQPSGGFIEIYDQNQLIIEEYRFLDNGGKTMTYFSYTDNVVIMAEAWRHTPDEEEQLPVRIYTDHYRYNRSRFLRALERIYHEEQQIDAGAEPVRIAFANNILDAAKNTEFIKERLSVNPEFFGDITVEKDSRMVYGTDERGRILTQTLFDEMGEIVWVISNTWSEDRIVSSLKSEADIELLSEYEYDASGSRIVERNLRNNVLERVVRVEGDREIEELYMNDQIVLLAIWEDGRKISETRIRNR